MFKYLVTICMIILFSATSYMSVSGLVSVFQANLPLIIILGVGMELGKILVIVHCYLNRDKISSAHKLFYACVAGVLILLTSCEVLGYLSLNHKASVSGTSSLQAEIKGLEAEATVLKQQINVVDKTLAGLPETYVSRRLSERKQAGYADMQKRLLEVLREKTRLKKESYKTTALSGPVYAVADIFGFDRNSVAFIFILVLVAVLEPLSIGLVIATAAAWKREGEYIGGLCDPMYPHLILRRENENETKTKAEVSNNVEKPEIEEIQEEKELPKNYQELQEILAVYKLTAENLMDITGKKQLKTVEDWLDGNTNMPDKALRAVWKYVRKNAKLAA